LQFENHPNYNCEILTDNGDRYRVYANWLHNEGLDHWQGWICHAGDTRLYIDKDLQVWSGECKNDSLGSALQGYSLLTSTQCRKPTCTGCTDDLMVKKQAPVSNRSKGRDSFDARVGNNLVEFFNKNVTPYPTDVGAPAFDLVPVERQKDIMLNVARLHAQQEYDRIMSLVRVLQQQADSIRRRLEITDAVHAAKYDFQIYHNQCYWLVHDLTRGFVRLVPLGPQDWSTGAPLDYQYIARVKWLGDYSWIEVDENGEVVADGYGTNGT
jgi:hypothetical protein